MIILIQKEKKFIIIKVFGLILNLYFIITLIYIKQKY